MVHCMCFFLINSNEICNIRSGIKIFTPTHIWSIQWKSSWFLCYTSAKHVSSYPHFYVIHCSVLNSRAAILFSVLATWNISCLLPWSQPCDQCCGTPWNAAPHRRRGAREDGVDAAGILCSRSLSRGWTSRKETRYRSCCANRSDACGADRSLVSPNTWPT